MQKDSRTRSSGPITMMKVVSLQMSSLNQRLGGSRNLRDTFLSRQNKFVTSQEGSRVDLWGACHGGDSAASSAGSRTWPIQINVRLGCVVARPVPSKRRGIVQVPSKSFTGELLHQPFLVIFEMEQGLAALPLLQSGYGDDSCRLDLHHWSFHHALFCRQPRCSHKLMSELDSNHLVSYAHGRFHPHLLFWPCALLPIPLV